MAPSVAQASKAAFPLLHRENRCVRPETHLDGARAETHLADLPTSGDDIADHQPGYSPLQRSIEPAGLLCAAALELWLRRSSVRRLHHEALKRRCCK
jgi:hypothetical protein